MKVFGGSRPKSGNLCRVFKRYVEGPSAGHRMENRGRNVRKNRFFNGKMCIFGHLGPGNTHFCGKCALFSWTRATFTRKMCVFPPNVATYVGFLSDIWKDPPRVTVWLAVVGNVLKLISFKFFWAPRALPLEKSEGFRIFRVQNSSRPSPLDRGRARSPQGVPRLPLRQGPSGGALRRFSLDRGRVRSL